MSSKAMPTLQGIPTELRLQIYDEVLKSDISCTMVERYESGYTSKRGSFTIPVRDKNARLDILWLNLMATCHAIRAEFQSHVQNPHSPSDSHTYRLDLTLLPYELGPVTWKHLPCAPNQAEVLEVTCLMKPRGTRFWGDGGPHNIVRSLYQLLNSVLHCGPVLDRTRPLNQPMRLRDVVIHFAVEHDKHSCRKLRSYEALPRSQRRNRRRRDQLGMFDSLLRIVCRTSILERYVERFRVVYEGHEMIFEPQKGGSAEVPEVWDRYGFGWGVEGEE